MSRHHLAVVLIVATYFSSVHGDYNSKLETNKTEERLEPLTNDSLVIEFIQLTQRIDDVDIKLMNDDEQNMAYFNDTLYDTTEQINTVNAADILESVYGNVYLLDNNLTSSYQIYNVQQHLITDLAKTIEFMAKIYIDDSEPIEHKFKIFQAIESGIRDTSLVRAIHIDNSKELQIYDDVITRSIDLSIKRIIYSNDTTESFEIESARDVMADNIYKINNYNFIVAKVLQESHLDRGCDQQVNDICDRIMNTNSLNCGDNNIVALDEICNGVSDCWNHYDELNCTDKVGTRCLDTINILSNVQTAIIDKCLPLNGGRQITYHYIILKRMLQNNWATYTKYIMSQNTSNVFLNKKVQGHALKRLNEMISMVSSLLYGLKDNLCTSHYTVKKHLQPDIKNLLNYDRVDDELYEGGVGSYESCTCIAQFCKLDVCSVDCRRVCWHKYSLNHYSCLSYDGDTGISLNLLCDGKYDCVDKTDETACKTNSSISKYEVNILYNELQEILSSNFVLMRNDDDRIKIITLSNLTTRLHHISSKSNVSVTYIAKLRKEYFNTLVKFYEDKLSTYNLKEIDHLFNCLMTLNERMVSALKKTYVSGRVGCHCYRGACTAVHCSQECDETCMFHYNLTRYSCDSDNTYYVHNYEVCDGNKDCPNGRDEHGCTNQTCERKHMVILRNNVERIDNPLRESAPREALQKWKIKVSAYFQQVSTLGVSYERAQPVAYGAVLQAMVTTLLQDLATTYSSLTLPSTAHHYDLIQKIFTKISSYVAESLKYCNIL